MGRKCIPQAGGHDKGRAFSLPELRKVVSQSIARLSELGTARTRTDSCQYSACTETRSGCVGKSLFQPVIRQFVPLLVSEIARGGGFEQRLRKSCAVAEPQRVHRSLNHSLRCGRSIVVSLNQFRHTSQVLRDLTGLGLLEGQCQSRIIGSSLPGSVESHAVERLRHWHANVSQQGTRLRVRVRLPRLGRGCEISPIFWPDCADHQYGSAPRIS